MTKNNIITPSIDIFGRSVGPAYPPLIIAELSANHNGCLQKAFEIVRAAKQSGAHAVKLQTYTADTITIKSDREDFYIQDGIWAGKTLYELYDEAHTPWQWHAPLFDYAREIGIPIFSSPFDSTAVDFLEDLNAPAYKIASFEAVDLPLIRYVASTKKPMIISTGMADAEEIQEAVFSAKDAGCNQLALLHCVSGYPASPADYNLRVIEDMISRFGLVVGLSDHTLDNITAITSVAMGASIIEKHVTLDRNGGGPDDSFSLEPSHLQELCRSVSVAWQALGLVDYGLKASEAVNIKFRRSLYFVKDLKAGDVVTSESIRSVRPGYGLPPIQISNVINRTLKLDVVKGQPVSWDVLC